MASQREIAAHLDLSPKSVQDFMGTGVLEKGGSLDDCRVRYIRHLRERAAGRANEGKADDGDPSELEREKTRLTKAQADERELIVERLRRTLIAASDVERVWGDMVSAFRAKMIGIPPKAASIVIAANDRNEAEGILRSMIYEALAELSEYREEDYDSGSGTENTPNPDAASQLDGEPVGGQLPETKPRRQRRARAVQQPEGAVPTGDHGRGKRPKRS